MLSRRLVALALACFGSISSTPVSAVDLTGYEFIVVGAGAGGGPLAARLALAGRKTLLIDAGEDDGSNLNYTVPAFQAKITEDPAVAWDFYVRHYTSDERSKRDFKLTYDTPGGGLYTGLNPPPGSTIKGILYPRAATLGGCAAHNALVSIYPHRKDFQDIADLTGDTSWRPDNLRKYFVKMENAGYLQAGVPGHGYSGWFPTAVAPISLALKDNDLLGMIIGAARALGMRTRTFLNLGSILAGDANGDSYNRDANPYVYQVPIATKDAQRVSSREFLLSVANARTASGAKQYPLDIRTSCYVTKVNFDTTKNPPRATGVSFLDGKNLYRASKIAGGSGVPGTAKASREVIIAGGTYNTPQILKLSGVGPAAELSRFGIPVIADLPGVGENLQDHYEVVVQGTKATNFTTLDGCTFDYTQPDACLQQWQAGGTSRKEGTYASSGFAAAILFKSSATPDGFYDELLFGGPVNFRGYFPGYAFKATEQHNWWSWDMLKAHPRNTAGYVRLRSADPLDVPEINFNYFDTGSGDYRADLTTIRESIRLARDAFASQSVPFNEVLPGASLQSDADIDQYIKDTAWGHHCSCTAPIGRDGDPKAVLDSSFRVRKVSGLRVADASVYPRIPGTFTMISTYLIGEKAADVILSQTK